MLQPNIGIADSARQEISEGLGKLLADTYTLYVKTHNFHWNVTGPQFETLHLLFEKQYRELAEAVDEIAERIRALGHFAPGSYSQFMKLTTVQEETSVPSAKDMLKQLLAAQEIIVCTAREVFRVVEPAADQPTADLLTRRMQIHEKNAWMLRSLLEN